MVPFQTVLALLTLLMMLSSCSQKAPPGSAGEGQEAGGLPNNHLLQNPDVIIKPPSPNFSPIPVPDGSSFLYLNQQEEKISLTLTGEDAKKIYLMTGVRPDVNPDETGKNKTLLKQGVQYSCSNASEVYTCKFELIMPLGTVPKLTEKAQINAPEVAQTASEDFYLRIESDAKPGQVVLKLPADYSETIYLQLKLPKEQRFGFDKSTTMGAGTHFAAKNLNCYQKVLAPSEAIPNPKKFFECFLHLNTNLSTVMDISGDTFN